MLLDAAKHYTTLGWHVFPAPVGADKKSHVAGLKHGGARWGATTDAATVDGYWRQWPGANIGIATGEQSGIFVVDVDTIEGHGVDGFATLAGLVMRHGPLPVTLTAESPSGSRHFYFKYPSGVEIRNSDQMGAGIDVRGNGGMVIAPPSVKTDGRAYFWQTDAQIADAPEWLIEIVRAPDVSDMPRPMRVTPVDLAEVEELLSHIDPDAHGYEQWQQTLAAIHDVSGGSDEGLRIADEWSARGALYKPGAVAEKWQDYKPGGGVSIGTIAEYAKRSGADVAGIGMRHRLMRNRQEMPVSSATDPAVAADSAVDLIMQTVQADPKASIAVVSPEIAKMPAAERAAIFEQCRAFGVKQAMQEAVKAHLAAYAAERGAALHQANRTGPFAPYFIVKNEFGQPVVMDSRGGLQPQGRAAFRDAMASIPKVPELGAGGTVVMRPAADVWWEDPETPAYAATGYDPQQGVEYFDSVGRSLRNVYDNGHSGPAAPVGPEAVDPFMHIIRSNFPDTNDQAILLNALGHMVQRPGVLLRWAPVMQGTPGCGKGSIAEAVVYAHGRANVSHPSPDVIARDFNDYMHRKTLVVVNEIGDHTKRELSALAEKLKPWVSDSPVHIEPKGKTGFDTPNLCNWIFTTNHVHCMLAAINERRYAHFISILQTEQAAREAFPDGWWAQYYDWWRNGGNEAVRGYLQHMVLTDAPSIAPQTSSTGEALKAGEGALQALIREAVEQGLQGFRNGWISVNAVKDLADGEDIKVPGGPYLAKHLEAMGYRESIRCNTSPAEAMRFPRAGSRTRVFASNLREGLSPSEAMTLYDAAQASGPVGKQGNVLRMPGV